VKAVAVTLSIACPEGTVQGRHDQDRALGVLAAFRRELYRCCSRRPDALTELADAVLCKPDRVHMLAELSAVTGRAAVPGLGGRPDPAGGRCEQLAAAGRGDQPGPPVLPYLRAR